MPVVSFCFLFVLLASLIPEAQGQCRNLRFTSAPILGHRLNNHVIRTIGVMNEDFCELQCYQEPNCVSYNFDKREDTNGRHKCDLNNATYEHDNEHSGDLAKKENYVYRGAENACLKTPCQNNATCQAGFTDRDYQCLCIPGFNGHDCENDIDECTDGTHKCGLYAVCNNTRGSYNCTCKDGFYGDGINCADIDECTNGTHSCDVNAVCNNTRGSYNCTCKDGFYGDGMNCTDIDECANRTHGCDVNAECNNFRGSYNCTCKDGFHGDGKMCSHFAAAGLNYSSIVGNNQTFLTWLDKWLKPVTHQSSYWNRCYQATVNTWISFVFHFKCDGKGPSVTIIRVGKYIFGGYTSQTWGSSCKYWYDSSAFLFSLVNKPGWQPLKLHQTGRYSYLKKHSIFSCSFHGPAFGRGRDIYIANEAASNTRSYTNLGYTYGPPTRGSYIYPLKQSFLAGAYKFRPDEIEVFYETS